MFRMACKDGADACLHACTPTCDIGEWHGAQLTLTTPALPSALAPSAVNDRFHRLRQISYSSWLLVGLPAACLSSGASASMTPARRHSARAPRSLSRMASALTAVGTPCGV